MPPGRLSRRRQQPRVLPLSAPLRDVLLRRQRARRLDTPLVFHWDGRPIGDWRKRWDRACQAAGLPGKRLHDCRRTAARNLIRAGVPEDVAMRITGHATRDVFRRYNIVTDDDVRAATDRLAAYLEGLPRTPTVAPMRVGRTDERGQNTDNQAAVTRPDPRKSLKEMAGPTRFELATSGVTGRRSNQLNYDPAMCRPPSSYHSPFRTTAGFGGAAPA